MGYLFKFRLTLLKSFRNVNQDRPDRLKAAKRRLADGKINRFNTMTEVGRDTRQESVYGLNVDDFTSVAGQTADIKLEYTDPEAFEFTNCNPLHL